jgi:DNA-binding CsgD family transcriptional regulator
VAPFGLTPRERELVDHLTHGRGCHQAAEAMGIKPSTVREYKRGAARKMGVTTSLQITVCWMRQVEHRSVYVAGYRRGWREARAAWEAAWKS